ncbi:MAG TPA: hypothetical protein VKZ53_06370 [Candidatus Angelobacter sp.]|nr:hypothetical protein [Candidatus Angelobacter sp.]
MALAKAQGAPSVPGDSLHFSSAQFSGSLRLSKFYFCFLGFFFSRFGAFLFPMALSLTGLGLGGS